jgi:hypothetical protein
MTQSEIKEEFVSFNFPDDLIIYDDFSAGLSSTKWTVTNGTYLNFTDYHEVIDSAYYVNSTGANKSVMLEMKDYTIIPSSIVQFTFNYTDGDGERKVGIIVTDREENNTCIIGHWNDTDYIGHTGLWTIRTTYYDGFATVKFTKGSNNYYCNLTEISDSYAFSIEVLTGTNGKIEARFDNFQVN